MPGVEFTQYWIDRIQINTEEAFWALVQWNKHQQDFIDNLHERMEKVEILTKGMAELVALKMTVNVWEKFDFLEKNAQDSHQEREELKCSINNTSYLVVVIKVLSNSRY
jgi:hypothetical protein